MIARVLLVLALIAAFLLGWTAHALASSSASRSAPTIPAALTAFGQDEPDPARARTPITRADVHPVAAPAGRSPRLLRGIASWGRGWAGVVTRLPGGTRIRVCGRLGCWSGRSTGYGPARWTHRIADLSPAVFREICGPLSAGLCRVTVAWS